MKVLWFSLSPCGSLRRNAKKNLAQGWMISLEDEIKKNPEIDLYVAYFSEMREEPFFFEGVHYYPMGERRNKSLLKRFLNLYKSFESRDKEKLKWLKETVQSVQPDLIHIHGTEDSFGLVAQYVKNIPVVYSIQGLLAPYSEKYFSGVPEKNIMEYKDFFAKLKNVGQKFQWKRFSFNAKRECRYLENAKYVLGRTYWDDYCTLALNPDRVYFIVNEILRPQFYKKQWKGTISEDTIHIISTISAGVYKGIETAIRSAHNLKTYSKLKFQWHIVGYTENDMLLKIAEKYVGIKAKDCNMVFHGRLDADNLSDLLIDSDLYVHVSHIENSPNSVCEAMILGLPVIASNTGGTASLLENNHEGILVQDGDSYVLSGAILKLVKNPSFAVALAKAARQRAILRHNPSSVVNELLTAYNKILYNI